MSPPSARAHKTSPSAHSNRAPEMTEDLEMGSLPPGPSTVSDEHTDPGTGNNGSLICFRSGTERIMLTDWYIEVRWKEEMASYSKQLDGNLPFPLCPISQDSTLLLPSELDGYERGLHGIQSESEDEINVVIVETHANRLETEPLCFTSISKLGHYLESKKYYLLERPGCVLPPGYEFPSREPFPPGDPLQLPGSDAPPPDDPSASPPSGSSYPGSSPPPGAMSPPPPGSSFVFLVDDLSPGLIRLLGGYLSIPPQVFIQHTSGGETRCHRGHQGLKSDTSCTGCFGHFRSSQRPLRLDTEISSMVWWSAGTYSADMNSIANQIRDESQYPFERVAWKLVTIPPAAVRGQPGVGRRLGSGVFRAYQVITELSKPHSEREAYTCALEERTTSYMSADNCGSWFCLRIP